MKRSLLLITFLASLSACSSEPGTQSIEPATSQAPTQKDARDPLATFTEFFTYAEPRFFTDVKFLNGCKLVDPIAYDVKKTDSLVSPYTAVITMNFHQSASDGTVDNITLNFAWQNEKWNFQNGTHRRVATKDGLLFDRGQQLFADTLDPNGELTTICNACEQY